MAGAAATLAGYLLGSMPFGYVIVRCAKGIDVRATGSGATGATNVMRNLGVPGFVATFVLDLGKGVAAVMLAARLTGNDPRWVAAAGVAAVAGHIWPVWLGFRGGKGVATGVGVFAALAPVPLGLVLAVFVLLVALFRYISLGSVVATAAFPLLYSALDHPPRALLLGAMGCALLIVGRHHANIQRLLRGTESKVGTRRR